MKYIFEKKPIFDPILKIDKIKNMKQYFCFSPKKAQKEKVPYFDTFFLATFPSLMRIVSKLETGLNLNCVPVMIV